MINGLSVVICKCGDGKVNGRVYTENPNWLVFSITCIFTGVAGVLDETLDIGDVVVSTELMIMILMDSLGCKLGEIPYSDQFIFEADPFLQKLALTVSGEILGAQKVVAGSNPIWRSIYC